MFRKLCDRLFRENGSYLFWRTRARGWKDWVFLGIVYVIFCFVVLLHIIPFKLWFDERKLRRRNKRSL